MSRRPDGQYTAPTDDALAFDVQALGTYGMNMVRLLVRQSHDYTQGPTIHSTAVLRLPFPLISCPRIGLVFKGNADRPLRPEYSV